MEIVIVFCAVAAVVAALTLRKKDVPFTKKARLKKSSYGQMQKLNLLLHNIEVYNGTPKGQKGGKN